MREVRLCKADHCIREAGKNRKLCNRHRYIYEKFRSYELPTGAKTLSKVTDDEVSEWQTLYLTGLTTIEVGGLFGRHSSVVHSHLKRRGIIRSKSEVKMSELNPMWVGSLVSYTALHAWVKRNKTKPETCEHCKEAVPYDLANVSQEYQRDINDFEWLCRKCHMLSDGRINNLRQYNHANK